MVFAMNHCGVLAPHNIREHAHERHGHKTTSSLGHEEEREEEEEGRERTTETGGNIFCRCDTAAIVNQRGDESLGLGLAQTTVV